MNYLSELINLSDGLIGSSAAAVQFSIFQFSQIKYYWSGKIRGIPAGNHLNLYQGIIYVICARFLLSSRCCLLVFAKQLQFSCTRKIEEREINFGFYLNIFLENIHFYKIKVKFRHAK